MNDNEIFLKIKSGLANINDYSELENNLNLILEIATYFNDKKMIKWAQNEITGYPQNKKDRKSPYRMITVTFYEVIHNGEQYVQDVSKEIFEDQRISVFTGMKGFKREVSIKGKDKSYIIPISVAICEKIVKGVIAKAKVYLTRKNRILFKKLNGNVNSTTAFKPIKDMNDNIEKKRLEWENTHPYDDFQTSINKALENRNYQYIEILSLKGENAEIHKVFSIINEQTRILKIYDEPVNKQTNLFIEDIKKLSRYEHENIVKVYETGYLESNNQTYFFVIMEYIEGINLEKLKEHIFRENISFKERINIFSTLLEAIETFRRQYDLHNDLHPGNILLTKENTIKIIDFGTSRDAYSIAKPDTDLYMIKNALLPIFFSKDELKSLRVSEPAKITDFNELKDLIAGYKETKTTLTDELIDTDLINYYSDLIINDELSIQNLKDILNKLLSEANMSSNIKLLNVNVINSIKKLISACNVLLSYDDSAVRREGLRIINSLVRQKRFELDVYEECFPQLERLFNQEIEDDKLYYILNKFGFFKDIDTLIINYIQRKKVTALNILINILDFNSVKDKRINMIEQLNQEIDSIDHINENPLFEVIRKFREKLESMK